MPPVSYFLYRIRYSVLRTSLTNSLYMKYQWCFGQDSSTPAWQVCRWGWSIDKGLRQEEARRKTEGRPSRSLSLIPQVCPPERRTPSWFGFRFLYYGKQHMRFLQLKPNPHLTELQSCKSLSQRMLTALHVTMETNKQELTNTFISLQDFEAFL